MNNDPSQWSKTAWKAMNKAGATLFTVPPPAFSRPQSHRELISYSEKISWI